MFVIDIAEIYCFSLFVFHHACSKIVFFSTFYSHLSGCAQCALCVDVCVWFMYEQREWKHLHNTAMCAFDCSIYFIQWQLLQPVLQPAVCPLLPLLPRNLSDDYFFFFVAFGFLRHFCFHIPRKLFSLLFDSLFANRFFNWLETITGRPHTVLVA